MGLGKYLAERPLRWRIRRSADTFAKLPFSAAAVFELLLVQLKTFQKRLVCSYNNQTKINWLLQITRLHLLTNRQHSFTQYHLSTVSVEDPHVHRSPLTSTAPAVLQARASEVFTKDTLYSTLPILSWAPRYGRQDLVGDVIAGLTVGLTVIPQAIAYATLAGLPPNVSVLRHGDWSAHKRECPPPRGLVCSQTSVLRLTGPMVRDRFSSIF